jgi:acyl phosphate:glycerol-3-phosphate acyltransferase
MVLWLALNGGILLLGYLLGSLPPGYLAGRWLKGIDIRDAGSGSTGATNVLRTLGKGPALVVFLIDVLKGSAALWLVSWLYAQPWIQALSPGLASGMGPGAGPSVHLGSWQVSMAALSAMAALLGHSKSIWLKFQGGKSVATSLGILLAMDWRVALGGILTFALVLSLTRIVSISSVLAALAVIVMVGIFQLALPFQLFGLVGGLYVIIRHRTNLQRLLAGTEPKIGQKSSPPEAQN